MTTLSVPTSATTPATHIADHSVLARAHNAFDGDLLVTGEEAFPRNAVNSAAITMTSQSLRLAYFTARKTETVTQVRVYNGAVAAGATPTLIRVGIWTTDTTGALLSQAAATTNDTTLLAGTHTAYTKALAASFSKTVGQRYAVGLLVVTAATAPQTYGFTASGGSITGLFLAAPVLGAVITGQSDLPSTAIAGSLVGSPSRPYIELLP